MCVRESAASSVSVGTPCNRMPAFSRARRTSPVVAEGSVLPAPATMVALSVALKATLPAAVTPRPAVAVPLAVAILGNPVGEVCVMHLGKARGVRQLRIIKISRNGTN